MTKMFKKALAIAANPESNEARELIKSIPNREYDYNPASGKMEERTYSMPDPSNPGQWGYTRELLLSEDAEAADLVQTEFYATVLEGAEPARVFRNVLPVVSMKSNQMYWPIGEAGTYAGEVAEGAEIPIDVQAYTKQTFSAKKIGVRPLITNEMIADSLYDVIEMEVRKAGFRCENKMNQDCLTELLDNAGNEHDCGGSNLGAKSAAAAISVMRTDNFQPDKLIMHPEYEGIVMTTVTDTAYWGGQEVLRSGRAPMNLLGMSTYVCSVADDSDTYTWAYGADGEIGAILIDSRNAAAIGMNRDLSVVEYDDPIRDLKGASVTMRYDVEYLHANAICRVEY